MNAVPYTNLPHLYSPSLGYLWTRNWFWIGNVVLAAVGMVASMAIRNLAGLPPWEPGKAGFGFLFTFILSTSIWTMNDRISCWFEDQAPWSKAPQKRVLLQIGILVPLVGILTSVYKTIFLTLTSGVFKWEYFLQLDIVVVTMLITTLVNAVFAAMAFYADSQQQMVRTVELERLNTEQRFASLQSQLNPHFLFNSLNTLAGLIDPDNTRAQAFLERMADVFRYNLTTGDQPLVPLRDELNSLNAYYHLLQTRFRENFVLEYAPELTSQQDSWCIPPLALQLLVENAVKHNIVSSSQPLILRLDITENQYLKATNNLQPKTAVRSTGIGLNNLKQRFALFSEKPVLMENHNGFFSVLIPLLPPESLYNMQPNSNPSNK